MNQGRMISTQGAMAVERPGIRLQLFNIALWSIRINWEVLTMRVASVLAV